MKSSPLLQHLSSADRSWRQSHAGELLLKLIPVICLIIAIAAGMDIILHLDKWFRLSISLIIFISSALLLCWLIYQAWIKSGPLLPIARLLEERDSKLGTKLINVIQLQEKADDEDLPELTRTLAARAIDEASQELEHRNFRPLTRSTTIKRSLGIALAPVTIIIICLFFFGHIASTEWKRFIDPFGDHPPFAFTQLTITTPTEAGTRVVYGQPSLIEVSFSGHHPKELFLTSSPIGQNENGEAVTIPLFPQGKKIFVQQIDSVESNLIIHAHNRSGRARSRNRHIEVILNPEVKKTEVSVSPPTYTHLRKKNIPLVIGEKKSPTITALVGSKLIFTLHSNRPLSDGSLGIRTSSPKQHETTLVAGSGDQQQSATAQITANESGRLRFDLRDESGLSSRQELTANLLVTHDLPPRVEITEPTNDGFIVENFAATVTFQGSDDYGLLRMRIHTGINGNFSDPKIIEAPSTPPQREMSESLSFTPDKIGAKSGDLLTFFADIIDIRPEAQTARTRTLQLEVISENDYNDFLRQRTEIRDLENKYATLHDRLKDLAKQQRELAKQSQKINQDDISQEKQNISAKQQEDLNTLLEKLAKDMESVTRENPLYDIEKDLQKVLNREAEEIRNSITKNQQDLSNFLKSTPSAESMQAFSENAQAQADRLDPIRKKAEQKIAEAIEDAAKMQDLLKALAAYQQLYQNQQQIASQSAAFRDKKELSREDLLSLQDMAGIERFISGALKEVVNALRKGSREAKEMYPLAAGDAMDIADAIEQANLSTLADNSSQTMLSGEGKKSHQQAEHLRAEMAKLISECQACNNSGRGEFEQRLRLMRSMMAGKTFSQMAQCRKFGSGGKFGLGTGSGMGMSGFNGNGNSQMGQSLPSLLGGESMLGQRSGSHDGANSGGNGRGGESPQTLVFQKEETKDSSSQSYTRPSTSLTGDFFTDEYRDLVEAYFRKLTKKPKKTEK